MAHSETWAKRLLRELPPDPRVVLQRARTYGDATFLRLFLEDVDDRIFNNKQSALRWAQIAPSLASAVAVPNNPEGQQEHRERLIRSLITLGSAYRACRQYDRAKNVYDEALRLVSKGPTSVAIQADVHQRFSVLQASLGRNEQALVSATRAVELLADVDGSESRATALTIKGVVLRRCKRYVESGDCWAEALTLAANPDRGSPAVKRLHYAICGNLEDNIVGLPDISPSELQLLFRSIRYGRTLVKGGRRSPPRYRLLWVEGQLWAKVGSDARAEKALEISLEGFRARLMPTEIALVTLALGAVLHRHGEWAKLERLASDSFRLLRVMETNTRANAFFSRWFDAIRTRSLTPEQTMFLRREIQVAKLPCIESPGVGDRDAG